MALPTGEAASHGRGFGMIGEALAVVAAAAEAHGGPQLGQRCWEHESITYAGRSTCRRCSSASRAERHRVRP